MGKDFYGEFLARVKKRKAEDPDRRFYLTGYSLGGGLAQLAALETDTASITFSSPGVKETARSLLNREILEREYGGQSSSGLENKAAMLSTIVVPHSDLVPKVDSQFGSVLRIRCYENMFMCHGLDTTIAEIRKGCRPK